MGAQYLAKEQPTWKEIPIAETTINNRQRKNSKDKYKFWLNIYLFCCWLLRFQFCCRLSCCFVIVVRIVIFHLVDCCILFSSPPWLSYAALTPSRFGWITSVICTKSVRTVWVITTRAVALVVITLGKHFLWLVWQNSCWSTRFAKLVTNLLTRLVRALVSCVFTRRDGMITWNIGFYGLITWNIGFYGLMWKYWKLRFDHLEIQKYWNLRFDSIFFWIPDSVLFHD